MNFSLKIASQDCTTNFHPLTGNLYWLGYWFILHAAGPAARFPLIVGCSVRHESGKFTHLAGKPIAAPGEMVFDFEIRFDTGPWGTVTPNPDMPKSVIFALWPDTTFDKSLADTDWQPLK